MITIPAFLPWRGGPRRLQGEVPSEWRAAIGAELDLEEIETLHLDLSVTDWRDGLEVVGRLDARVARTCGISLELFTADMTIDIRYTALPSASPHAPLQIGVEIQVDLQADDPPDLLDADGIDVVAMLREQFILALPPYPRRPGVAFQPAPSQTDASPFSALKRLLP